MLSRLFTRSLRVGLQTLTLIPQTPPLPLPKPHHFPPPLPFSTHSNNGGDDDGRWRISEEPRAVESLFGLEDDDTKEEKTEGGEDEGGEDEWGGEEEKGDVFGEIDREVGGKEGEVWETAEGFKVWGFGEEEGKGEDIFGIRDEELGAIADLEGVEADNVRAEEVAKVELEEKELKGVLKGPNRAFGDLIATSGITDEMLDSLILLKDVSGVEGLPPLEEIEHNYAKKGEDTSRFEQERKRQQEITEARVSKIDEKGRAYGTGKRKCSIARVFLQPGDGKFIINDKQIDAYFTWLDHRAEILSPFLVTDTIGLWDVKCTVKGGGLTGQVGAIRLGISRALQNWSPVFRELLRPAGLLTRDSRVVERKKPGKAKARKSFQWVKR